MTKIISQMVTGLLGDNFRHWKSCHYQAYQRMVGCRKFIGIEIETNKKNGYNPNQYLQIQNELTTLGFINTDSFSNGNFETTYLFDVTDPKKLVKKIKWVVSTLNKLDVPTTGGLHINIQCKYNHYIKSISPHNCRVGHSNWHSVSEGLVRIEFKTGAGFFNWEDLLAQFIIKSHRMRIDSKLGINDLKNIIVSCYPKGRQLTMINYSKNIV